MTKELIHLLIGAIVFGLIAWAARTGFPEAAKWIIMILVIVFVLVFLLPLLQGVATIN